MQQTVYKCDECKKEIGESKHVSLSFGPHSGIAVPPKRVREVANTVERTWRIPHDMKGMFLHFCSTEDLKKYFDNLMGR